MKNSTRATWTISFTRCSRSSWVVNRSVSISRISMPNHPKKTNPPVLPNSIRLEEILYIQSYHLNQICTLSHNKTLGITCISVGSSPERRRNSLKADFAANLPRNTPTNVRTKISNIGSCKKGTDSSKENTVSCCKQYNREEQSTKNWKSK